MSHRILYILDSLQPCGAGRQALLLTAGLPRPEFEVQICALGDGPLKPELEAAGAHVTLIDRRWKWDPGTFLALRKHLGMLRPAVVHSWLFEANAYGRAAALAVGLKRLIAVERHLDRWKRWPEWLVDRRLARRTSCLVANSEAVRDYYVRHGVSPPRFEVIPDGVPPLPENSTTREQLLAELDLPTDARLIGAMGELRREQRYKDLIWSTDILKMVRDDTHLLICGAGPHDRRLLRYRRNVRIEDRVHFLGQRENASQVLNHLDVFWLAGDRQGMPLALLEAMAAGVPVVASDTASHRAIVEHGRTGFLAPVGDRASLARYAYRLLEDPALSREVGAAGRQHVLTEFSSSRMVERYAELYRQLLD